MINTQTGMQGFLWFFGQVVDVDDPELLGRVKVYVYDQHRDISDKDDFRWAIPILPVTSPSAVVGTTAAGSTCNLVVGSTVFGFFADSGDRQQPMILGSLHTAPNFPSLSGISVPAQAYKKRVKPSITSNDPRDTAAPQYPDNNVFTTPAGHTVEFDNTEGVERITVHHSTGSYVEINKDGDVVIGSTRAASYSSANQTDITARGNINLASEQGNIIVAADRVVNIVSGQHVRIQTPSSIALQAGAGISIDGEVVTSGGITCGGGASGAFTTPSGQVVTVSAGIVTRIG
jgi:hypothetical protein